MRASALLFLTLLAACSGGTGTPDSGSSPDGGDAGPPLTDGGPLGSACSSLAVCGGNPFCGDVEGCSAAVICAAGVCASAGGPPNDEAVTVGFGGPAASPALPTYLQIYLLAPELVASGTLDCGTLLNGIDAGTLNPNDITAVNPLLVTYEQRVTITSAADVQNLDLDSAASGPGRVLYIEGYLDIQEPDGGALLLGRACVSFDDTDAGLGMTSATMDSLW